MDQFKAKFLEEAEDLIAALEKALLALENGQTNTQVVEEVFRVMHTLKGNSTMFGFEYVGEFTHHLETIFDLIRQGKKTITSDILDISLTSIDHLRLLLSDESLNLPANRSKHAEMMDRLIAENKAFQQEDFSELELSNAGEEGQKKTVLIQFIPQEDFLKNGSNPLFLIDELHAMGTCRAFPRLENFPHLSEIEPTNCYTSWYILLATKAEISEIKDVFLFVEDEATIEINVVAESDIFERPGSKEALEQMVKAESPLSFEQIQELLSNISREEQIIGQNPAVKDQKITSIRVPAEKLDKLMNLVSELVTTQAHLSLFAEQKGQPELLAIAEEVEKISRRLRDDTFSISLIPIEHLFVRFQRLVRDLSQQLNKEIRFVTEGGETELDKSVIENLADPLLHVLRNSIDHGIESAGDRALAQKPAQGQIRLKAFNSGTYVNIQIQDDGGGINPEKILSKAKSKKLIPEDAQLSESEIYNLLFLPGFSTASQITEVSGRGVGMDVVKRKVTDLRGEIFIASELGKGTSITIRLPLTLSVIDGLLVKIADTHFVIPLSVVNRCYEIKREQLANSLNESVVLDEELTPYIDLKSKFGYLESNIDASSTYEYIILTEFQDKKVGIIADVIIGEYQAVLKPLGKIYKHQDFVSGATILGDGTIALVMDTSKMINKFSIQAIK